MRRSSRDRLLPSAAVLSVVGLAFSGLWPADAQLPADPGIGWQTLSLVRVFWCALIVVTVLLGPGLAARSLRPFTRLPLGFVPVPGMLLLAAAGLLAWTTAGLFAPGGTSRLLLGSVLIAVAVLGGRQPVAVPRGEGPVLAIAGLAYLVGIGKSLWSQGPPGELYARTISRTLEVGDRPDSRISYYVSTLIAHGWSPNSPPAAALYGPYWFSDRGPVPGLLAAPVVLATGGNPSGGLGDESWSPFDGQGFMAYRLVLMALAAGLLLAVHSLVSLVAGRSAALITVVLLATTPFILHEVYFTWPKLVAAAQCVLAAYLVLIGRPVLAGLFVGLGFLMHPVALFGIPALLLIAVLAAVSADRRVLPALRAVGGFALGVFTVVYTWGAANAPFYDQGKFLDYVVRVAGRGELTPWSWIGSRVESFNTTLLPLWLPLFNHEGAATNVWGGESSSIVHFFFQYWNAVPFGLGIVAFPFAVMAVVRLLRRNPLITVSVVVVPFLGFLVYWGFSDSGLMREGLHPWFTGLVILVAIELTPLLLAGGASAVTVRIVLVARTAECLVMLMFPTLVRSRVPGIDIGGLPGPPIVDVPVSDTVAVLLMVGGLAGLAVMVVRATRPVEAMTPGDQRWWAALSPRPDPVPRFRTPPARGRPAIDGPTPAASAPATTPIAPAVASRRPEPNRCPPGPPPPATGVRPVGDDPARVG